MKLLTSISFEIINKVRITILDRIDSLGELQNFIELPTTDFNIQIRVGLNTQITFDESDPIQSLRLFEEESYYILIEANNNIDDQFFLNPFLNSIISWYPQNILNLQSNYAFKRLGEFKTKSNVGIWDFSSELLPNLFINISTKKISFNEDFNKLISDISEIILELTTKFGDIQKLPYSDSYEISNSSLFLESIHLQTYIYELLEAVDYIISSPYSNNIDELSYVQLGTQRQTDYIHFVSSPQNYIWRREGPLKEHFSGYTPITINNIEKIRNLDNVPNRFVKFVLVYFSELLYEIKATIEKIPKKSNFDNIRLNEVSTWSEEIEDRLSNNLFKSISSYNLSSNTSQVLEKRVGYQDVNRIFTNLQTALKIDLESDIEYSNNYYSRPISDLYEIWCFLQIVNILLEVFEQSDAQSLINIVNNRIKVNLKHGQESKITLKDSTKTVNIYYNFLYSTPESYTETYKPDITLEIIKENTINRHHFDAKYKLNKYNSFKEEDLWKMHAYKDGINFSQSASILYPGINLKEYYRFDGSFIYAIPLKPDNNDDVNYLQNFIISLLKS